MVEATSPSTQVIGDKVQSTVLNFIKNERTLKAKLIDNQEWTVLAAFVAEIADDDYRTVALGTGTKSIGRRQIDPEGRVLNDCHAEILARRSLHKTLMKEI